MSARLPNKQEQNLTATNEERTDLMVRALIRHVTDTADSQSLSDPVAPGVLLDLKMEGVRCLLVRLQPQPQSEGATQHAHVMLSPREEEIARMVAAGYPNKTIAAVLDISSWTVGTHLRRVFAKLGVGSRAAMVARLLKEGSLRDPARRLIISSLPYIKARLITNAFVNQVVDQFRGNCPINFKFVAASRQAKAYRTSN